MRSNVRNLCSHLLKAKGLVDDADPQLGVSMDREVAVIPLLTPEASNTAPEISSMPRTGNGHKGDIQKTSSHIDAIGGE